MHSSVRPGPLDEPNSPSHRSRDSEAGNRLPFAAGVFAMAIDRHGDRFA